MGLGRKLGEFALEAALALSFEHLAEIFGNPSSSLEMEHDSPALSAGGWRLANSG